MTLQERLAQAQAALHALLLGRAVVEVRDANGESVRYQIGSAARLRTYIRDLEAEIAGSPTPVVGGPLRPMF